MRNDYGSGSLAPSTNEDGYANASANGPQIWVVVPAYNESSRLSKTLCHLLPAYPNVVVVDDGSTDSTVEVARQFPVWILRHTINCGQGAALQTGIDFAIAQRADIVVTFDADGQHRSDDVSRVIAPVADGRVDICLGSRFLGGHSAIPPDRWVLLKLAILFTRLTTRLHITDTHNGLRAMSCNAARLLHLEQPRMAHASEILHRIDKCRLSYCEAPVQIEYRPDTLRKGQTVWDAFGILAQLAVGRLMR